MKKNWKYHSKQKGNIGETAVALDLLKNNYSVFTELGDLSKIDLITIIEGKMIRVQVKSLTTVKDVVGTSIKSSGPNYSYKYTKSDVDIFAIYVLDKDIILYVSLNDFGTNGGMAIRFKSTKNGQKKRIRNYKDYLDILKAIKNI